MSEIVHGAEADLGEWLLVYDRLNPEIPRSNPAEDVSSTDDSENNTTDTDNKKGDRNVRFY